jgi:hypothetical protein
MSRSRNREQRTKPSQNNPLTVTLSLNRKDRERLDTLLRESNFSCEDIFRIGLDDLSA